MTASLLPSDYGQLRAFAAVADALNFSRAAESLAVTPSALSQTIRQLEQSLGTTLLQRTTRKVSLTPEGEQLLLQIKPAINGLSEALQQVQARQGRPAGTVRVHATRSASRRYIEPMLGSFLATHPEIMLDISLDDETVDVVGGGFDMSLRLGELIEQDMVAIPLGPPMRQIAVATPAYIAAHGAPETPGDLLRHPCIRWRWPGRKQPYDWEFCENGRWFEVRTGGPLIVNDKLLAVQAALQGIGIAFCAEEAVRGHLQAGRLQALLEPWCEPFPGIHLCYPRQRQMAPALRAFIDAVRRYASTCEM
ncbi:LysR family transcriptional regulator [Frateuria aurantia]